MLEMLDYTIRIGSTLYIDLLIFRFLYLLCLCSTLRFYPNQKVTANQKVKTKIESIEAFLGFSFRPLRRCFGRPSLTFRAHITSFR